MPKHAKVAEEDIARQRFYLAYVLSTHAHKLFHYDIKYKESIIIKRLGFCNLDRHH